MCEPPKVLGSARKPCKHTLFFPFSLDAPFGCGRTCTHLTWQPCRARHLVLGDLSSSSPLACQPDARIAHCCLQTTKGGSRFSEGAGNSRWIILGPGKPVLKHDLSSKAGNPHCVLIGRACGTPPGRIIVQFVLYFHLSAPPLSLHRCKQGRW